MDALHIAASLLARARSVVIEHLLQLAKTVDPDQSGVMLLQSLKSIQRIEASLLAAASNPTPERTITAKAKKSPRKRSPRPDNRTLADQVTPENDNGDFAHTLDRR